MQTKPSEDFKKFFLLQFTKELIKHSVSGEVFQLKEILEEESHEQKEEIKREKKKVKQIIKEKKELEEELPLTAKIKYRSIKKEINPFQKFMSKNSQIRRPRVLRIPEPKLPSRFQYLTPTPTQRQIDLGKLNPLINDPAVKNIDCDGPGEEVKVVGTMGIKKTDIILTKEEIDDIIKKFSESSRIPVHEGIFRVVVGKLIFSAVISDVVGSRFIIKKMIYSPVFR